MSLLHLSRGRRHREAPPRVSTKLRELRHRLRIAEGEFADLRRTEQQQRRRADAAEAVAEDAVLAAAAQAAINERLTSELYVLRKQAADAANAGAITVPPMVRDTTAPDEQATAPHGVRTVNGPAARVMPLAAAAGRGHFGVAADTMPPRQLDTGEVA